MSFSKSTAIKPVTDEFYNAIAAKLNVFYSMSNAFQANLRSFMYEVTYKKGSHILNAGAKQPMVWFALDGLLQEITVNKETFDTKTTWFWFGFAFVYAAPGFFDQESSNITINVVRDSRVAFVSYEKWKILKDTFEETEKLTEILRSDFETLRKLHLNDINTLHATDRYLKYESQINQLFQHIKLKEIAEFLGMSTDTLGKIRRKILKQPTI